MIKNNKEELSKIYGTILENGDVSKLNHQQLKEYKKLKKELSQRETTDPKKSPNIIIQKLASFLLTASIVIGANDIHNITTYTSKKLDTSQFRMSNGKTVSLCFYNNHVKIKNSYQYSFPERIEIINFIREHAENVNHVTISQSTEGLESEWYLHNLCYEFGLMKSHAQDADLDYEHDPRLLISLATYITTLFYQLHDKYDMFTELPENSEVFSMLALKDNFEELANAESQFETPFKYISQQNIYCAEDMNDLFPSL